MDGSIGNGGNPNPFTGTVGHIGTLMGSLEPSDTIQEVSPSLGIDTSLLDTLHPTRGSVVVPGHCSVAMVAPTATLPTGLNLDRVSDELTSQDTAGCNDRLTGVTTPGGLQQSTGLVAQTPPGISVVSSRVQSSRAPVLGAEDSSSSAPRPTLAHSTPEDPPMPLVHASLTSYSQMEVEGNSSPTSQKSRILCGEAPSGTGPEMAVLERRRHPLSSPKNGTLLGGRVPKLSSSETPDIRLFFNKESAKKGRPSPDRPALGNSARDTRKAALDSPGHQPGPPKNGSGLAGRTAENSVRQSKEVAPHTLSSKGRQKSKTKSHDPVPASSSNGSQDLSNAASRNFLEDIPSPREFRGNSPHRGPHPSKNTRKSQPQNDRPDPTSEVRTKILRDLEPGGPKASRKNNSGVSKKGGSLQKTRNNARNTENHDMPDHADNASPISDFADSEKITEGSGGQILSSEIFPEFSELIPGPRATEEPLRTLRGLWASKPTVAPSTPPARKTGAKRKADRSPETSPNSRPQKKKVPQRFLMISSSSSSATDTSCVPDTQWPEEDLPPLPTTTSGEYSPVPQGCRTPELSMDDGDFLNTFEEDLPPSPPGLDAQEGPLLGTLGESLSLPPSIVAGPPPAPAEVGACHGSTRGVGSGHLIQHSRLPRFAASHLGDRSGELGTGPFRAKAPPRPPPAQPCGFAGCTATFPGPVPDVHLNEHFRKGEVPPDKEWLGSIFRDACPVCHLVVSTKTPGNWDEQGRCYMHGTCKGKPAHPPFVLVRGAPPSGRASLQPTLDDFVIRDRPPPAEPMILEDEDLAGEISDPGNPVIREIFSRHVPTIAFIPKRAIKDVGAAFAQACELARSGDWIPICAFAKTVLWAPPKDSLGNRKLFSEIQTRAKRFVSVGWRPLWDELPDFDLLQAGDSETPEAGSRRWREMVLRKAKVGSLSSTFRMLTSNGVAGCDEKVFDTLVNLHPPREVPIPPPLPTGRRASPIEINAEAPIRSFPKGTAPGPDGFKPQYLKDLLRFQRKEDPAWVVDALEGPLQMLLAGRVPKDVAPHLAGARLIPLIKKEGGIRPIAVGCCLRRLASKIAASSISKAAADLLLPHQVGVSVPGGSEALVEAIGAVIRSREDDPDQVVLQIDFANAFNSVHRAKFIEATEKYLPDLAPWIRWTYDTRAELLVSSPEGPHTILSEEGCQQGDPLGPLMFCLAIHELILEVSRGAPGLHLNAWYFDDGTLVGPSAEVHKALNLLEPGAAAIGLYLNRGKSVLYWPHSSQRTDSTGAPPPKGAEAPGGDLLTPGDGAGVSEEHAAAVPEIPDGTLESPEMAPEIPPSSHDPFAEAFARSADGIVALGAPIGDDEFVAKKLGDRLCKAQEALRRLPLLDDPQVALLLLRNCTGFCRIVYLARALNCASMRDTAEAYDRETLVTLEAIVGALVGIEATLQAQQPIVGGGLGLRSALAHLGAARLASVNKNRPITELVLTATQPAAPLHSDPEEPLAQLARSLHTAPDQVDGEIAGSTKQRVISSEVDASEASRLWDLLDERDRARFNACKGPSGSLVLTAAPVAAQGTRLSSQEFRFFLIHRLGLRALFEVGQPCPCCHTLMDAEGYHALTCRTGGSLTRRHNAIRNIVYQACRKAAWNPALEVSVTGGTRALVPADVYVPKDILGTQALAIDITVVNPLQVATRAAAATQPGAGAAHAETKKRAKHAKACSVSGLTFIPMAIEVFGHIGPAGIKFIEDVAGAVAGRAGQPLGTAVRDIKRRIAFALIKAQAEAVLLRTDQDWEVPGCAGPGNRAWLVI